MGFPLASTVPHARSAGLTLYFFSELMNTLQAKKGISYAVDPDSDEDSDDEDAFKPTRKIRPSKRRKTGVESDDDVFVGDAASDNDVVEEG